MQCESPIKASISAFDGSISYYRNSSSDQPIGFPCRKCLPCRLNTGREKSIQAFHEAKMHGDNNCFLTLTYDDEHLESPRLIKSHIQHFNKNLRNHLGNSKHHRIKIMYTGEYGEENKRPHWHLLIFNYRPSDCVYHRKTPRGDTIFKSQTIEDLWGKNNSETRPNELGELTIESASYVARYAAKKLVHGLDQEHNYHPIHEMPKSGLGRTWIEKYWEQTFNNGYVLLPNYEKAAIPRFYKNWCKKHQPKMYVHYMTEVVPKIQKIAEEIYRRDEQIFFSNLANKTYERGGAYPLTQPQVKRTILGQKFKKLQEYLKL